MAEQRSETGAAREAGPATIYDVARAANVSAMTVSRVINGNTRVDADLRERVRDAIAALNYKVNLAARSARTGSLRIGLLFGNPSAAFMSDFLVGAMDHCSRSGAQLMLESCGDLDSQQAAVDKLVGAGADGILVPPPLCDSADATRQLHQIGMPVIAIATARPAPDTSAVRIDDYQGALSMMRHLIAAGHRDIAFITGDRQHTPAQLRYQAYIVAMAEAGMAVRPERVAEGLFTYRSGLAAARALLGQSTRPSAVFACNDDMAAAVIAVAHGMGLRVPQDLAVCGFDDTPIATAVWPELTTIRQPIGDMARVAVDMVIEEIRRERAGQPRLARHSLLPFALVERFSTCCATGNSQ